MKLVNNLNLQKFEIQNARIQNLAADPGTPVEGQFYWHTVDKKTKVYNGTVFVDLGGGAAPADATTTSKGYRTASG